MLREPIRPLPKLRAVTGIGSLPFKDVEQAIEFVEDQCPEIPFWPQLPKRSRDEHMIRQFLPAGLDEAAGTSGSGFGTEEIRAAFRGDRGEDFADRARGFGAFLARQRAGGFGAAAWVKGQLTGPVTLAAILHHEGTPCLDRPGLFSPITAFASRVAAWQTEQLRRSKKRVIVIVDEPSLHLGFAPRIRASCIEALNLVFKCIRGKGGLAGLHCCQRDSIVPFAALTWPRPDLISFDASNPGDDLEGIFTNAALREFARRGGGFAFGILPTGPALHAFAPERAATTLMALARSLRVRHPGKFFDRCLITASCGLARATPAACRRSFAEARAVLALLP